MKCKLYAFSNADFGTSPSAVELTIGDIPCTVSQVTDGRIICSTGRLYVGNNQIKLRINNKGKIILYHTLCRAYMRMHLYGIYAQMEYRHMLFKGRGLVITCLVSGGRKQI